MAAGVEVDDGFGLGFGDWVRIGGGSCGGHGGEEAEDNCGEGCGMHSGFFWSGRWFGLAEMIDDEV